jgi:hypothetical protein
MPGDTLNPLTTTAPFSNTRVPPDLHCVIGVNNVHYHLHTSIGDLKKTGTNATPVLVPVACDMDPVGSTPLRDMLFIPDVLGGSGWVVTADRFEQKLDGLNLNSCKLNQGPEMTAALLQHPEMNLDEHNASPSLAAEALPYAWMRTAVTPAAGATVDGAMTTAPHAATSLLHALMPVLGVSSVRHHMLRSLKTLRDAGAVPVPVFVPIAVDPSESEQPPLRPFFFVPDTAGGAGFLITEERWENSLVRLTCHISKLLLGQQIAEALAARPELGLEDYNRTPTVPSSKASMVVMRTAVAPAAGATVDPTITTGPFTSMQVCYVDASVAEPPLILPPALIDLRASRHWFQSSV